MKLMKTALALTLLAAAFAGGYLLRAGRPATTAPAAPPARRVLYYVDPMHPAYTSDKPGIAPDCGMTLEPVYADSNTAQVSGAGGTPLYYRDPDEPGYIADAPGRNPRTGHALEPVFATAPADAPPAHALAIPLARQQLIGVTFATVTRTADTRTVRTSGRVAADDSRVGHVHTRLDGWIGEVFAGVTGTAVHKGDPLLTIFSPDMVAAQQELLLAGRARDLLDTTPLTATAKHGTALVAAARQRLRQWDFDDAQIQQVLDTGQPITTVTVRAPMDGLITERRAYPNQRVTTDSDLYTITDLGRVWVIADVFEPDAAGIGVGARARVTFPQAGTAGVAARVTSIQPDADPTSRTLRVRLDVPNPGMRLRPEMSAQVEFSFTEAPQLTVPADAVLDTGNRQTAFVDLGNGYLEPRAVVAGERVGERIRITSGLAEGERVAASAAFLLDAESQLRSAPATGATHQHEDGHD